MKSIGRIPLTWLAVVLVHNEKSSLVTACLDSMRVSVDNFKQKYPDAQIAIRVVDDSKPEYLAEWQEFAEAKQVELIYCAGNISEKRNAGWLQSDAEIIIYTDADCVVHPDWVEAHASIYAAQPNTPGVAGITIHHYEGSQAYTAAHHAGLLDGSRFPTFTPYTPWAPCCNISVRSSVLVQIGGFDTTFSYSGEDVDLGLRIFQKTGKFLACVNAAPVTHDVEAFATGVYRRARKWGEAEALLLIRHPLHHLFAPPRLLFFTIAALLCVMVDLIAHRPNTLLCFIFIYLVSGPWIEGRTRKASWAVTLRTRVVRLLYQWSTVTILFKHRRFDLLATQMIYFDGQYDYEWPALASRLCEFLAFLILISLT
jgi:glycosyltransferase involved in cell wall biosynthesis